MLSKNIRNQGIIKQGQKFMIQSGFTEKFLKTRSKWENVFYPGLNATLSFHSEFYGSFHIKIINVNGCPESRNIKNLNPLTDGAILSKKFSI